jgi:uncharacterized membrane protein
VIAKPDPLLLNALLPWVRAAHVAAVVLWIGGVGFVTTVVLPAVRRDHPPARRLDAFQRLEGRFSWQARFTVAVAGVSGLWMIQAFGLWDRFRHARFWWMHAMVLTWSAFAVMLYLAEPLFLHRALERARRPERAFRAIEIMHWILLALSLVTVIGAVAGAHGA